jgi:uncharacterized membrane protein
VSRFFIVLMPTAARSRARTPQETRHLLLLGGIILLAAVTRFSTLDARSFWTDEAVIINLGELGLWDMLHKLVTGTEGTPPLYYVLALGWSKLFGTGEIGLRSLSALVGTATVPVAYLAGRELVSRRVGLIAALLFAVSPILVWHSQDARAHSLAVLLCSLSFLFFLRALRAPRTSTLIWWAVASGLGILTHYYVAFPIAVEGAWLLLAHRSRRPVWGAMALVGLAGIAALMVAAEQRPSVDIAYNLYGPLSSRLVEVPAQLLVGEQPPFQRTMAVAAALLVIPALVVLVRTSAERERRGAAIAAAVGGAALAAMILAALLGVDYLSARNALPVLLPGVLVVACGFAVARGPVLAALVGLCVLWLAINIATASEPKFEREDWRGAAEALGTDGVGRAIVVTPQPGRGPLLVYRPRSGVLIENTSARLREIDIIGLPPLFREVGRDPEPPRPAALPPVPAGFRLVAREETQHYTVLRFRSEQPRLVSRTELERSRLASAEPEVLVERASGR